MDSHPNGLISVYHFGKIQHETEVKGELLKFNGVDQTLLLKQSGGDKDLRLFRYKVVENERYNQPVDGENVLDIEKNLEYYILNIKNDMNWLNQIKNQAEKDGIDLEEAIRNNAQYMVDHS